MYINGLGRGTRVVILALAVIFVSAGISQAATTITTSISTANVTATGTLGVTGIATFVNASSTNLSALTKASFGSTATSSFNSAGDLTLAGTLKVGTSGTAQTQVVFGYCNTSATSIAVAASTYSTYMTAPTLTYRECVPATAVTFTAASRVIVQATSSLPSYILVQSASTTTNGNISVGFINTSTTTASTAIYALNFWAVQ